mgnify:CR=1 FL=1
MRKENYLETNLDTKGKGLFLRLVLLSLVLTIFLTILLWWFVQPRLSEISPFLSSASLIILIIFYAIIIVGTLLIYLGSYFGQDYLISKFAIKLSIALLFPVSLFLGRILGLKKSKIRESFIKVNNSFFKRFRKKFRGDEVLILLPHCLQYTGCDIRITVDIKKCIRCGKCDIASLVELAERYDVNISIATGGTLARRIIKETRPKFVIAVACDRDLFEGIRDVFPIPAYGVLNQRPNGPCINTKVAVEKIKEVLTKLVNRK